MNDITERRGDAEILATLARLDERSKATLIMIRNLDDKVEGHMREDGVELDFFATRLRTVEQKQAWYAGAAASIGIVGGILIKKLF